MKKGKIVLDFSEDEINVNVINGLTFYKKEIEYEKKMPVSEVGLEYHGKQY